MKSTTEFGQSSNTVKKICKIYGKKNNCQLLLPVFYHKKYGSNILGLTDLT